jgi:hypothetical protein
VLTVTDLINECQLVNLIGDKCKPPDHSVLNVNFTIKDIDNQNNNEGDIYFQMVTIQTKITKIICLIPGGINLIMYLIYL